jgi:hypothetical protein
MRRGCARRSPRVDATPTKGRAVMCSWSAAVQACPARRVSPARLRCASAPVG